MSGKAPNLPGSCFYHTRKASFTGREHELQELASILLDTHPNPAIKGVLLCGPQAIGKTALAVEFCWRFAHQFKDIFWLQAQYDLPIQLMQCADKTGSGMQAAKQAILKLCSQKDPPLLVFDHLENPDIIIPWLEQPSPMRILATWEGFDPPEQLSKYLKVCPLTILSKSESLDLFIKLAPHLNKNQGEYAFETLLKLLEGQPHALNLAARNLANQSDLSIEVYLEYLHATSQMLTVAAEQQGRNLVGKVSITAAVLATSWKNLHNQPLVLKVFQICGYCAPHLPIPWAVLAEAMQAQDETAQHNLFVALNWLYEWGLLLKTERGCEIHALNAEFSRWIEQAAGEINPLFTLVEALSQHIRRINETEDKQALYPLYEHTKVAAQAAETQQPDKSGALLNSLGYFLWSGGAFDEAQNFFKRAMHLTEHAFGSHHPNLAAVVNNLGQVLESRGRLEAAHVCYEQAQKIWSENLPPAYLQLARVKSKLADILKAQGNLREAQVYSEEALVAWRNSSGSHHSDTASALNALGEIFLESRQFGEAQACFIQALNIWQNFPETKPVENIRILLQETSQASFQLEIAAAATRLGSTFLAQKNRCDALTCFERALQISEQQLPSQHPQIKALRLQLKKLLS